MRNTKIGHEDSFAFIFKVGLHGQIERYDNFNILKSKFEKGEETDKSLPFYEEIQKLTISSYQ